MNTPSQISSNVVTSHKFRFTATSAYSSHIMISYLLGCAGTIGTATNSATTNIYRSVRIKSVEVWSPIASIGSFATCSVNWFTNSTYTNSIEVSDTSVSVTTPAHVISRPPKNSLASFWLNLATDENVFVLTCPTGSIIDVSLQLVVSDDEAAATTNSVATAVIGTLYYLALDGPSSNLLVPVSLVTTH